MTLGKKLNGVCKAGKNYSSKDSSNHKEKDFLLKNQNLAENLKALNRELDSSFVSVY
jgi:hypothetical protein